MNFLTTSQNAIDFICKFATDNCLLQLREVSKFARDVMAIAILNTRRTHVLIFSIVRAVLKNPKCVGNEIEIGIEFENRRVFLLWKCCCLSERNNFKFLSFRALETDNGIFLFFGAFHQIVAIMNFDGVRKFFKCMKPLFQRAEFQDLKIGYLRKEIFHLCEETFVGIPIPNLFIFAMNTCEFESSFHIVRELQPDRLVYNVQQLSKESVDLFLQFSELVDHIWIKVHELGDLRHTILTVVREMLSRKCNTLRFYESFDHTDRTPTLSIDDAEKLIQFFHHAGKQFFFHTKTELMGESASCHVGAYEVILVGPERDIYVTINHLGLTR